MLERTKHFSSVLGIAILILGFGWMASPWREQARVLADVAQGAQSQEAPTGVTKRALLIGINNYKYPTRVSPLAGSLNDVEDMRQVLVGKFEFAPENILVLKDAQATHAGIMDAIRTELIAKTKPGDIVVVHYSGHGSQMKDVTGKRIGGLDETIVPYDSRDPDGKIFDISGAELHTALVQLAAKTKNLTFILDSCHSGTLVRGARVRSVAPDERNIPASTAALMRGTANTPDDNATPKFAFISAATSKESAFEHFAENRDHGALTYFLTRQLRSSKAGVTYRDVMDPVMANVTANYPAEHPALEGAEADQTVFGDTTSLAGAYVPATPSLLDPKHVTLSIGQVEGATVGSTFDVYPPGSRKFAPPERPQAKVQLISVEAFTAEASVLSGAKVALASRAIERQHKFESKRARVFLDDVDNSPTLQALRTALQGNRSVEVVDRPTACNIQLRTVDGNIQTLAADASTLSGPLSVNDPAIVSKLTDRLQAWAKWFNVLAIRNSQGTISVDYSVKAKQTRDAVVRVGKPDASITEGDMITATLTNNSERDLYVTILDLSSDGSVSVVYPSVQGSDEVLRPAVPFSHDFTTFVPKGRTTVTDVLKVFASYKPLDLSPLKQGSIGAGTTRGDLDPLQELLDDSTGVTRNVAPLDAPVDLGTWTTLQRALLVRRKR